MRVGNQVFVTGTIGLAENGSVAFPGDAGAQAKRALEIIEKALSEAGAKLGDVVRTRMYITNLNDWESVGKAHGEVFGEIMPATTLIQVAGFIDSEALVEIEADAIVGDSTDGL